MSTDYSRFGVYQTDLDFNLECSVCDDWRVGEFSARDCRTLADMIALADEHWRVVHGDGT